MTEIVNFPVIRWSRRSFSESVDSVVREHAVSILVNGQKLVTLLCTLADIEYLAVGYLLSEGTLKQKDDIVAIRVNTEKGTVNIETGEKADISCDGVIASSGWRGPIQKNDVDGITISSNVRITPDAILSLVDTFVNRSQVFKETGGVHSAALCDINSILVFKEDIGRHNAIDKVFGNCCLDSIPTENSIFVTSGRISSEIALKIARRSVPVLVSKAAPTDSGIRIAQDTGLTLIGFARVDHFNIYANSWRVDFDK